MAVTTNTFAAVGNGTAYTPGGAFNAELRGTFNATMQLERTLDGTNWVPLSVDVQGNPNAYLRPVSLTLALDADPTAQYRWVCTNFISGSVSARLSP